MNTKKNNLYKKNMEAKVLVSPIKSAMKFCLVILRPLFCWQMIFTYIIAIVLLIVDLAWVQNYWKALVCFWIGWYGAIIFIAIDSAKNDK